MREGRVPVTLSSVAGCSSGPEARAEEGREAMTGLNTRMLPGGRLPALP